MASPFVHFVYFLGHFGAPDLLDPPGLCPLGGVARLENVEESNQKFRNITELLRKRSFACKDPSTMCRFTYDSLTNCIFLSHNSSIEKPVKNTRHFVLCIIKKRLEFHIEDSTETM